MLHDILCLANSLSSDKYRRIIFELSDKKPRSVNNSLQLLFPYESNLRDWLREIKLNNAIQISLHSYNCGSIQELRVINKKAYSNVSNCYKLYQIQELRIITNKKEDKPYFLYEDYPEGQRRVKAGAIYTRNGSSNTPIDKTATDFEAEKLWKQRFGLNIKDPLERLKFELKKIVCFHKEDIEANWSCTYDDEEQSTVFFNRLEPSLGITFKSLFSETICERNFDAKWGALKYACPLAIFGEIIVNVSSMSG